MSVTIKTNHVPRGLLDWEDLTLDEQAVFAYIDIDNPAEAPVARFFRYRGSCYDLHDGFERLSTPGALRDALAGWDGFQSDSFFSGIAVRFPVGEPDFERVVVGMVYAS